MTAKEIEDAKFFRYNVVGERYEQESHMLTCSNSVYCSNFLICTDYVENGVENNEII